MFRFICRFQKSTSLFLLLVFLVSNNAWALTSGPSQPETQQFAPAGMDNMVDPFTGDFSYNIPLMDVGGYPININYAAGITPDQEASWTGLGWNLNVGAINRNVRGLADDFNGDPIETHHSVKPNETVGINYSVSAATELFTFPIGIASASTFTYNSYTGFGFSKSISPSIEGDLVKKGEDIKYKLGAKAGFTFSYGSDGVGLTPSAGLTTNKETNDRSSTLNANIGFPYSSREGAKGMSMGVSFRRACGSRKVDLEGNEYFDEDIGSSGGTSSFHGFSTPTYTTQIAHDVYSVNASLTLTPENITFPADVKGITLGGFYSGQFTKNKIERNSAYGYLYEGLSQSNRDVLDFNREKDGGYNENTTNFPVTNHTYDIFSVSGEGVGGTYRIFRGDVGVVGDNVHSDESVSPDLGLSGGLGQDVFSNVKFGVDFTYGNSYTESGRWDSDQFVQNFSNPKGTTNSVAENTWFGKIGEASPENIPDWYNNTLLQDKLYEYESKSGILTGKVLSQQGLQYAVEQPNKKSTSGYLRNKRRNRTSTFSYLTAEKAEQHAIDPKIASYSGFALKLPYSKSELSRITVKRKKHHLSEIRVTGNNGSRYVYGIPVYNNVQHDVTFSVETNNRELARQTGLVSYSATDASTGNQKGLENYFNKTIVPASATSYLLNYILSSDYVDSDGIQGPSDGDLGTYVKFNYTRTSSSFKWRTPYEAGMANYQDGLAGKSNDDKGSYSYGEKEIWYLHSIETRTHVAEFHTSTRFDGRGVAGEAGGISSQDENMLRKLDKIILYAKPDKRNARNEALKTVHFDYSYELCPGTPNSAVYTDNNDATLDNPTGGKLTLKKVWFTYGNSNKGVLNPYEFFYADRDFNSSMEVNFPYSSKNYDRWGVYKEQIENLNGMNTEAYPYTIQNKELSDKYAAAYAITKILTPTGGEMRIHYESDDYGYVQDKAAMRMYTLRGVSAGSGEYENPAMDVYDGLLAENVDDKLWLHIDLGEGFPSTTANAVEYFKEHYLGGMTEIQYRIKMNIQAGNETAEYINGYCGFDENNILVPPAVSGYYNKVVIKLSPESLNRGNKNLHPFVKNAWLYARLNYNREIMDSGDAGSGGVNQIIGSLLSATQSIINFVYGFRGYMALKGNGRKLHASESFVRLYEHDKIKIGGGHRVKAIVMFDRWNEMLSDQENGASLASKEQAGYGQVYAYTTTEDGRTISSGVAAYEPIIGGDENPIRKLVKTTDVVPLAPNKEHYSETPFGESFFPAPTVGYSSVRTTPVKITSENYVADDLASNGTGYVQQEFYTAKDFPTRTSHTGLDPYRQKSSDFNPLNIFTFDYVFGTQGYRIELNDMHGKAKSTKVMPDGDENPISYVRYEYKTSANDPNRLDNNVPLVTKNLDVLYDSGREVGMNVDVVNDTRYSESQTKSGGGDLNVKLSIAVPVVIPLVTFIPNVSFDDTYFYSLTTTKIVNRYGILQKTIAQENGQTITTENLAWDEQTGDVLLTKVENEFHDPLYSFTYPAYWAYQTMGFAYANEGFEFSSLENAKPNLIDGDEFIGKTTSATIPNVYGYYDAYKDKFLNDRGAEITQLTWGKIVRSGARNMAMTPIASVSTRSNPIVNNKLQFEQAQVLNAGATEFKHIWKPFCNCGEYANPDQVNPFTIGKRGQLRPWRSWTYLTERSQHTTNVEINVRQDGYFTDYKDFWKPASSYMTPVYQTTSEANSKWQFVTQIVNYNPLGMEIENKDALKRYSMAQYGYGRNLPIATSNNSKYQESGFDGFEDYDYGDCNDDHFSWRVRKDDQEYGLTDKQSHTGKKSFKVPAGGKSKIIKTINECDQE